MGNVEIALVITVLVHFAGIAVLVWALYDPSEDADWRGWWKGDDPRDGWPEPPAPQPSGDGLPIPLADAVPARVRLREAGRRIADGHPRPERRPSHVPAPARERETV